MEEEDYVLQPKYKSIDSLVCKTLNSTFHHSILRPVHALAALLKPAAKAEILVGRFL